MAPPLGLRDTSRPLRGRGEMLHRLETAFRSAGARRTQVLCGMGGCGKTAVALEMAHRRADMGERVWWIDARQGGSLEAGFRAVARQAGATEEQLSCGDAADVLWLCLTHFPSPWLLVVDNADDPTLLDGPGSLPAGTGWLRPHASPVGNVLVTSRDSNSGTWGSMCSLNPVHPLTGEDITDAVQILLDYAPGQAGSVADAHRLATRLGGLPLALGLAGRYLAEVNQVPTAYRDPSTPTDFFSYERALAADLRHVDPANVIGRTWAMSVRLLEKRGDSCARLLLEVIATFADAPLPYTLVLTPNTLTEAGDLAQLDGPGLWKLLTALAGFGLLDLVESEPGAGGVPTARLHPLVRDATWNQQSLSACISTLHCAAMTDETGTPEEAVYWNHWRLLQPHGHYLFQKAKSEGVSENAMLEATEVALLAARYLHAHGMYQQARAEFEAVLAHERDHLGETHKDTIATRHRLAQVLHDQGELKQARAEYEAVLDYDREHLGEANQDTLTIRHDLAIVLHDQGELEQARAEYEAILTLRRELLGETHRSTLSTRHELARVLHDQGELEQAQAEYEAILTHERELLGEANPAVLVTRHNLARVWHDQGNLEEALADFEAVLEHKQEQLGETHPDTLGTRHELARVLQEQGELEQARAEYETVLAHERVHLGETHPETLTTRHNVASLLEAQGDLEGAREEYEAVLALRRKHLGEAHNRTLSTRQNLACLLYEQGELEQARTEGEAILALRREQMGDTHPDTKRTVAWLRSLDIEA
ncbi:FxSxx-COOH system tetratricopeptide repeat protein [Streptomyces sp. NBC_00371]|uniref:FxSxx-COOH system tetratricopeptide repeat protein n=1 Tax=Streptomyces sp. NBC_00371 TaxID=2975729 RepID=UPI002E271F94